MQMGAGAGRQRFGASRAQPVQSAFSSAAPYASPPQPSAPPQSPPPSRPISAGAPDQPAQPQGAFNRLYSSPQFQDRIARSSPRMAEMHTANLRNIAAKQDRLAGRPQYSAEENRAMQQEWEALRGREVSTPFGSRRVGGVTNDQARALMNDPESARRLAELSAWRTGGQGPAPQPAARPTSPPPAQQRPPTGESAMAVPGQAQAQQSPWATSTPYGGQSQAAGPGQQSSPQSPQNGGRDAWLSAGRPGYDPRSIQTTAVGTASDGTRFGSATEARAYDRWLQSQPGGRPAAPPQGGPQRPPPPANDPGASIRNLLQGYNIPAGVLDQISGMFGGGQPGPPQAATPPWPTAAQLSGSQQASTAYAARPAGDFLPGVNYSAPWQNDPSMPLPAGYEWRRSREGSRSAGWLPARVGSPVASAPSSPADVQALQQDRFNDAQRQVDALRQQQFPQMPSPPPGFDQFGTPAAQQRMYQDSMMAWTMPKQNLLSWGQQAAQLPWAPNYGNMPDSQRPPGFQVAYNNPFGSNQQDIIGNRDAFIGSILNNQANRFVGTQTQPGPVNRPAYDPSQLWQQAQGMLGGGWQNPFAAR